MSKNTLNDGHFDRIKTILSESRRVRDALPVMTAEFGLEVTSSKLEKYLAKRKYNASDFINYPSFNNDDWPLITKEQADEVGLKKRTAYIKRLEKALADRNYFTSAVQETLIEVFKENPIVLSKKPVLKRDGTPKERLLTALVSDWHFGLIVDPEEVTGNAYNWTIAARRLALYAQQIASWKPEHRNHTKLNIVLGGDMLCGTIHMDDAGVRPLAEQMSGAVSLLVQFLDYLRQHFDEIQVNCAPGNHERISKIGPMYAQRWNSYATPVYLAVAMAFRDHSELSFNIPKTGEVVVELPSNELFFYTHGDVAPSITSVGSVLDIKPITNLVKTLNSSGEFTKPVRVFAVGHWHSGSIFTVGLTTALVNGSGIGPDSYARGAVNIRGHYGSPAQILFESTKEHSFGDSRFVRLEKADLAENLDLIINPPKF